MSILTMVMATIQIGDVLVSLESQGDPGSRIFKSLKMFVELGCDVIVCPAGHTEIRPMLYMRWLMMAIRSFLHQMTNLMMK